MTTWLAVRGMGLVYSLPHVAACHALNIAARAVAPGLPLPEPDLGELAPLLARYYGEAPPPPLRRVPRYARYGLLAALRALERAGWDKSLQAAAPPTMLALGTAYSGMQMSGDFMDSMLDQGPRLSSPTAFSHAVNNMGAGLVSLLLGLRGSCQTISQFSLSFAGALQAAALALHSGRTHRALVGALDETDPRFALSFGPEGPCAQGAVFLCLERAQEETGPQVRVLWGEAAHAPEAPAFGGENLTLLSGDAATGPEARRGVSLSPHYGHSPLAQALDVFLALRLDTTQTTRCLCAHARYGAAACVEVRRHA